MESLHVLDVIDAKICGLGIFSPQVPNYQDFWHIIFHFQVILL